MMLSGCASAEIFESPDSSNATEVPANSLDEATKTNETSPIDESTSHSKGVQPDYDVVFPQDRVNRIDITLSAEAWTALHNELEAQFGASSTVSNQGAPGQNPPANGGNNQQPQGLPPGGNNNRPGGAGGGLNLADATETSYVSATVTFDGETWNSVGFRYSGNSTLRSSWRSGTDKISFRLDFDEFEDVDPSTEDQRFFGFKQIAFKSNSHDSSYLREKVVADLFRDSGVAASQTAFYEVYLDHGEGSECLGLFTAVEIVDDTVIKTQFEDDSGNVYKPEGMGAAFIDGTFSQEGFEKQTNEEEADWSDIQAVFEALNSDLRMSDPAVWRQNLESVFDVDAFIRWLAVDTIIQNWDTYGNIAHNYYLYTDPTDGLVTWIPWDNNEALKSSNSGGNGGPAKSVRALDLSSVGEEWPLIRYLMDDPVYFEKYRQYLSETVESAFQPEELSSTIQKYHELIAPSVLKETQDSTQLNSIESFDQSAAGLIQYVENRYDEVIAYLTGNYSQR